MGREPKRWVNPYLIALLKRMLAYEVVQMGDEPSRFQIADFCFKRACPNGQSALKFRDGGPGYNKEAHTIGERVYAFLRSTDYSFTTYILDCIVKELTLIDGLQCWVEFRAKYEKDSGATMASLEDREGVKPSEMFSQKVLALANRTIIRLHYERIRVGASGRHTILAHQKWEENIIRTASIEELKDIEKLSRRVMPCPINGFEIKKPWLNKNPNTFYVYIDDYGLWGHVCLLPLKPGCYALLKSGKFDGDSIAADDIHSLEEREQAKYIYVESLVCTIRGALPGLASVFTKMINSLAVLSPNLVICAIPGSIEGIRLLKRCGFNRTGWITTASDGLKYEYHETTLGVVQARLKGLTARLDAYNSLERMKFSENE
jgi:hypothetical protein